MYVRVLFGKDHHTLTNIPLCYACIVVWGFDKKTVAVLKEMQSRTMSHLSQENSDVVAAELEKVCKYF